MYKQNKFIKLSEIAKILDISRPLLQKWEKIGLPVIRRKKGVAVVTEAGLIRFLSSGKVKNIYLLTCLKSLSINQSNKIINNKENDITMYGNFNRNSLKFKLAAVEKYREIDKKRVMIDMADKNLKDAAKHTANFKREILKEITKLRGQIQLGKI